MPRDLAPEPPSGEQLVLTASPETRNLDLEDMAQDLGSSSSMFWNSSSARELMLSEEPGANDRPPGSDSGLHPHVQTLSIDDLEACVALENAAFPENERCSREKVCGIGVV